MFADMTVLDRLKAAKEKTERVVDDLLAA